jgi:aryl-alcohol dehydrogenase-like predicted oxidoreductase
MRSERSATEEGTESYAKRFPDLAADHFRKEQGLWFSSIGIGTYLGEHDPATDALYEKSITTAINLGCNVIDTAINYRFQRSERSVGIALTRLMAEGKAKRSEVIVATKGGFLPFDGSPPRDIRSYFVETFVKPGVADFADVVAGAHCMTPRYIANQVDQSLKNLQLDCLDIYYLHNPETQLGEISREEFHRRILAAFETLERMVEEGKIRIYGIATWNGLRNPSTAQDFLSLQQITQLAHKARGSGHHFRVVQLPYNLAMPEAFVKPNQKIDGEVLTPLEAAKRLGITVVSSASVYQGNLTRSLPAFVSGAFPGLKTDAQRAIQFNRSTPGLTSALVGMKEPTHVQENLDTARVAPVSSQTIRNLFTRKK